MPVDLTGKKYLVFSGGGIHGISHIGVVTVIKKQLGAENFKKQFVGFAGTSIGAFLAMILTCECNMAHLFFWMTNPQFFIKLIKMVQLSRLMKSYGLIPASIGVSYLRSILQTYGHPSDITFRELYERTQKTLCVCVVNISTSRVEYHSYQTTPYYKVAESVFASMCIPVVCEPTLIQGHYFYDGGLLDNFPLQTCGFPLRETIGIYLEQNTHIGAIMSEPPSFKNWASLLMHILYTMCNRPTLPQTDALVVTIPQYKGIHCLKLWAHTSEFYMLYIRGILYAQKLLLQ